MLRPARTSIQDFPLRGVVSCAHCGKALTACWSTSKTGAKHPYYMCFAKDCTRYRKSIRREQIESAFAGFLERLEPTRQLFDLARAMFAHAWNQRLGQAVPLKKVYEREASKTDKEIEVLLDRIVQASSQTVVSAFERRIASLERRKLVLEETQAQAVPPQGRFEQTFELAFAFLSSPSKLWHSGKSEYQKLVLRLTLADHLAYCPRGGFSNPKISLPFKMLEGMRVGADQMAEGERLKSNGLWGEIGCIGACLNMWLNTPLGQSSQSSLVSLAGMAIPRS